METQKGVERMGRKTDNFEIQINNRSALLNLLEKNSLQEWIDFVFSQKKWLSEIWDKNNYFSYLKTIFPNSKIKNLARHWTDSIFDEFDDEFLWKKDPWYYWRWFYFFLWKQAKEWASHVAFAYTNKQDVNDYLKVVLLDIQNPLEIHAHNFDNFWRNIDWCDSVIVNHDYDAEYDPEFPQETRQICVKKADQIYVLWSEKDILWFSEYMKNRKKNISW